jgi:uncharacterized protein YjiS (DUF1127 family)
MSVRFLSRPFAAQLQTIRRSITQLPGRLLAAAALSRSRKGLLTLDDHLLTDVGLTRAQALNEARRPSWDAPSHWTA